ncbi:MAG TPA: serine hydrolase domain-containing protein [Candidatus Dormibacteraeota bacterium]|nr:serine hydrolase domain-containing protein [Candidatus Dormibacteraeota bacterium]
MTLSVGQAAAALDLSQIDALFADLAKPNCPGASVMIVHDGKVVLAKGYGLANIEQGIPCGTNTNFRLASVTKQFTAASIMLLHERKKLGLEEKLTDFFPEFPVYGKTITVRHLLTHTSGLIDYEDIIPQGTTIPLLDRDVLRLLMQQDKTCFAPGSKFRYSNSGYSLLSLIVEVRSAMPFAQFLKQNIFGPLGMWNSLAYEQGFSIVPNRAYGYSAEANGFVRTDQSLTSSVLGDGGVYSSVTDLYKWDQALYGSKLLKQDSLDLIFTPGPASDQPENHYGFGWYIGTYGGMKEIWHSGNTRGFTTRINRFPDKRFTVIILANRNEAKLAGIPHKIADLLLK